MPKTKGITTFVWAFPNIGGSRNKVILLQEIRNRQRGQNCDVLGVMVADAASQPDYNKEEHTAISANKSLGSAKRLSIQNNLL